MVCQGKLHGVQALEPFFLLGLLLKLDRVLAIVLLSLGHLLPVIEAKGALSSNLATRSCRSRGTHLLIKRIAIVVIIGQYQTKFTISASQCQLANIATLLVHHPGRKVVCLVGQLVHFSRLPLVLRFVVQVLQPFCIDVITGGAWHHLTHVELLTGHLFIREVWCRNCIIRLEALVRRCCLGQAKDRTLVVLRWDVPVAARDL